MQTYIVTITLPGGRTIERTVQATTPDEATFIATEAWNNAGHDWVRAESHLSAPTID